MQYAAIDAIITFNSQRRRRSWLTNGHQMLGKLLIHTKKTICRYLQIEFAHRHELQTHRMHLCDDVHIVLDRFTYNNRHCFSLSVYRISLKKKKQRSISYFCDEFIVTEQIVQARCAVERAIRDAVEESDKIGNK